MDEGDVFDEYRRTISRNEDYIRQYGTFGFPDWKDKWHPDLEDAYSGVKPFLSSVTKLREFKDLPGELDPFYAENHHHALVKFLNPPERWFGNLSVLRSPGYLSLKSGAEEEAAAINAPIVSLNDTGIALLRAMDEKEPLSLKQIANKADLDYEVVRRYSKPLQEANLIKKIGSRGFVRLISLARLP